MLIVLSLQPFRASRLRTAIFSSGMHCKVTKFLVGFQILPLCASTYVNLCELMSTYARYLDVFLQNAPLFCIFVVRLINTIYQLCLLPIITIKTPVNRRPSVAWSSPRVISPSFCLALPGKSSRDSYAKIQTSQASLSSVDERFFLQR